MWAGFKREWRRGTRCCCGTKKLQQRTFVAFVLLLIMGLVAMLNTPTTPSKFAPISSHLNAQEQAPRKSTTATIAVEASGWRLMSGHRLGPNNKEGSSIDRPGSGEPNKIENVTVCQTTCNADAECAGFTWDPSERKCWMKDDVIPLHKVSHRVTTGLKLVPPKRRASEDLLLSLVATVPFGTEDERGPALYEALRTALAAMILDDSPGLEPAPKPAVGVALRKAADLFNKLVREDPSDVASGACLLVITLITLITLTTLITLITLIGRGVFAHVPARLRWRRGCPGVCAKSPPISTRLIFGHGKYREIVCARSARPEVRSH
jgi:hypothetical protein